MYRRGRRDAPVESPHAARIAPHTHAHGGCAPASLDGQRRSTAWEAAGAWGTEGCWLPDTASLPTWAPEGPALNAAQSRLPLHLWILPPKLVSANGEWMSLLGLRAQGRRSRGAASDPSVRVGSHLVLFSVFAASALLDVRVGQMCEGKAGNVGGRDGEPGIRRRVWPALLRAPGRWWWGKVLGCLERRLGAEQVTCCL